MGLFSQIFGRDRRDGLFLSEMQHLTNKVDQVAKNFDRIEEIRDKGVTETDRRELSVRFITNTESKAKALVSELESIGYRGDWEAPMERSCDYRITARTEAIPMSEDSIAEWTNLMCDLAAAQDCEFTSWEL